MSLTGHLGSLKIGGDQLKGYINLNATGKAADSDLA